MKKSVRIILMILLSIIFLYSAGKVAVTWYHYRRDARQYEEIRNEVMKTVPASVPETSLPSAPEEIPTSEASSASEGSVTETEPPAYAGIPRDLLSSIHEHEHSGVLRYFHTTFDYLLVRKYVFDFEYLVSLNDDIAGWIRIDGTNIDYPFVQGEDNAAYLRLGPDGRPANAGTVFMDYRIPKNFSGKNVILYAHNQQNLQMFHQLLSYKDPEFLEEHPMVDIYLPDGSLCHYLVFAAYETEEMFPYRYLFSDDEDFQEFIEDSVSSSYYDTGITPGKEDRILTLVTCTKNFDEKKRNIVQAVLLTKE